MVSQRQRLARKRYKSEHPELFPKPEPTPPKDPEKKKKKKKNSAFKRKRPEPKPGSRKRHPLRVPGMKPGESCFICKAMDHIAKLCPEKAEWEKNKVFYSFPTPYVHLIIMPSFSWTSINMIGNDILWVFLDMFAVSTARS